MLTACLGRIQGGKLLFRGRTMLGAFSGIFPFGNAKILLLRSLGVSLIASVITSTVSGLQVRSYRGNPLLKAVMPGCFAVCLVLMAGSLWSWGAVEVRGHGSEVFLLTFWGFFWLIISSHSFSWFGLCIADDLVERRNPAAMIALPAALLAIAMIYTGGSLGEGPSYWNNIFSAGLGTIGFFALWFGLELGGRVSVSLAEERNIAAGVRLCGFFLAIGIILARAVAGDWHSESATVRNFILDGWPVLLICVIGILAERVLRPSRQRPFPPWPSCGLLPALAYLGAAVAWVFHLGRWEGMPK